MNKIQFKTRKEVSDFLKEKNIDTTNWTEEKWQSINKSQAEIHIQALAESMWDAQNESKPNELEAGEWHMPFIGNFDSEKLLKLSGQEPEDFELICRKIATARCARLSYMTFDGVIDYRKDLTLHDDLLSKRHMSPFEHCARVMSRKEYDTFIKGELSFEPKEGFVGHPSIPHIFVEESSLGWCNNFRGFIQYRHLIEKNKSL